MAENVLRTPAAARLLGMSSSFLCKARLRGDGPKFIRLGRRAVGYLESDLKEWLGVQRRQSTSEGPESSVTSNS